MDSGRNIESHQEGYNTRHASETVSHVYLFGPVSVDAGDYAFASTTYQGWPCYRRLAVDKLPVEVQVGEEVPAS